MVCICISQLTYARQAAASSAWLTYLANLIIVMLVPLKKMNLNCVPIFIIKYYSDHEKM